MCTGTWFDEAATKPTWAGHVARMAERRSVYRALVWKPEGKRPLGRPRRRLEDNIKVGLRGSGVWGCGVDRAGSG